MPIDDRDRPERRAAGVDHAEDAARGQADGLEDREVAGALAGDEQQGREQVHEADGDEQEARAEQDRADVGALDLDLVGGELGGGACGRSSRRSTACGSAPGASVAMIDRVGGRGEGRGGEDQDSAVVVGLDVAADELERGRVAGDADRDRVADLEVSARRRGRGRRSPRRAGRTCARRGRRRGTPRSRRRARARAAPAARAGDLEPGERRGVRDGGVVLDGGEASVVSTRTSNGLARSAGSSITRW